ncbi:MAG: hypothetical protein AAGF12_31990 [Myxococcota bacterium]
MFQVDAALGFIKQDEARWLKNKLQDLPALKLTPRESERDRTVEERLHVQSFHCFVRPILSATSQGI